MCGSVSDLNKKVGAEHDAERQRMRYANAQRTPVRLLPELKCVGCASSPYCWRSCQLVAAHPSNQPYKQRSTHPSTPNGWYARKTLVRCLKRRSPFRRLDHTSARATGINTAPNQNTI
jgi:hypothetical protein